jgi:hypothetical protein
MHITFLVVDFGLIVGLQPKHTASSLPAGENRRHHSHKSCEHVAHIAKLVAEHDRLQPTHSSFPVILSFLRIMPEQLKHET